MRKPNSRSMPGKWTTCSREKAIRSDEFAT